MQRLKRRFRCELLARRRSRAKKSRSSYRSEKGIIALLSLLVIILASALAILLINGGVENRETTTPISSETFTAPQRNISITPITQTTPSTTTTSLAPPSTSLVSDPQLLVEFLGEKWPNVRVIAIGEDNSNGEVYVFYDFFCPYCAKEFSEAADYLKELTSKGVIVYLVDFLVHDKAIEHHAVLRCLADRGFDVLEILHKYSKRYQEKRKWPTVDELLAIAGNPDVSNECIEAQKKEILVLKDIGVQELGLSGTPTTVIWNKREKPTGIPGYVPLDVYRKYIETVLFGNNTVSNP